MNKRSNRNIWRIVWGCVLVAAILALIHIQTRRPLPKGDNQSVSSTHPVAVPANSGKASSAVSYTPATSVEALHQEETAVAERLLEDLPNAVNSIALRGQVYHNHGNVEEATNCLQRCLALNPQRADVYSALGEISLLKGENEKAASLFQRALEISPTMRGVHNYLARALMGHGKIDEAVTALEQSIKLFPKVSQSHWMLGQAHLQLQAYTQAKQHYQAAINIQADYGEAYYGLATACARLGQKDVSKRHMETFKGLKAEHLKARADWITHSYDDLVLARQSTAWTFMEAGRIYEQNQRPRQAELLWRKAAILDPKNKDCRMHLAMLCLANNRQREALEMCEQIGQIEPDKADTHLMIGIINLQLRRFDNAEQAFSKAIELAPQHPEAYCRLASLYLSTNRKLPEARALAETAVQLQPTAPNYVTLCQARDRDGDFSGALAAIKRAMALDPENTEYPKIYAWMQNR